MARVKKKEHEKLTKANIQHVINLLNPTEGKPITKKEACSILNITYNTTRLNKIIEEFEEQKAFVERRKAENRGKRATPQEITEIIYNYLSGEPVSEIAKGLFRSPGFVKGIINRLGIPSRPTSAEDRGKVSLIPEQCISEEFSKGEIVWSGKYHAPAIVISELSDSKYKERYLTKCYKIYIMESIESNDTFFPFVERGGYYAHAPACDLGALKHLEEYNVDLTKI